jgi:hypothetical protein
MDAMNPTTVRYIKLGEKGQWEDVLDRGELPLKHAAVHHELALTGDRHVIKAHLVASGRDPRAAADDAREIVDFYTLGPDCLWITFARDRLWWTRADPEVIWQGGNGVDHGLRMRKAIGGWRDTDLNGQPLRTAGLSGSLTQSGAYRRTICSVAARDYLLRRINGIVEPIIERANSARKALIDITAEAIASLHWVDLETLVDIVFARSGWHRVSALGGSQKTVDLELEQPTTGERAMVQVKAKSTQAILDGYITWFDEAGTYDRLFFVCPCLAPRLLAPERSDIHVWAGQSFAVTVVKLGLHDWILEKVA